jgi:signal transduction histidine kinase
MGLAIAKGIVTAHGGRIWIEDSASGHGARIIFTVPVGDDDSTRDGGRGVPPVGHAQDTRAT